MLLKTFLLGAAAATSLAPVASASAAAMITASAATAQAGAPTAAFLIGRWTDNDDCSDTVEFLRDGGFRTSDGVEGRWVLAGDQLTFVGDTSATARVVVVDNNTVRLEHPDGTVGRSTRCTGAQPQRSSQAPTPRPMPALPASVADALATSGTVRPQDLIGKWTDTGDCSSPLTFLADGRFLLGDGAGGRWTLRGETLTFSGEGEASARIRRVGNDRIILIHADNGLGQSIRC